MFTAAETGAFFVDVQGNEFIGATGDYELTANIIEDDFTDDVTTTGVLTADGIAATGTIDFANDVDWFALEVTQGELYTVCLLYTSPSPRDS